MDGGIGETFSMKPFGDQFGVSVKFKNSEVINFKVLMFEGKEDTFARTAAGGAAISILHSSAHCIVRLFILLVKRRR